MKLCARESNIALLGQDVASGGEDGSLFEICNSHFGGTSCLAGFFYQTGEMTLQNEIDFQKETDELLIGLLRDGREEVTDYIMNKYKNLVRKRANAMYLNRMRLFTVLQIFASPDRFTMRWKRPSVRNISH